MLFCENTKLKIYFSSKCIELSCSNFIQEICFCSIFHLFPDILYICITFGTIISFVDAKHFLPLSLPVSVLFTILCCICKVDHFKNHCDVIGFFVGVIVVIVAPMCESSSNSVYHETLW